MGLFSLFLASCPLIEGRQREWNGREALASLEWNFSAAEGPPAHNPQINSFQLSPPLSFLECVGWVVCLRSSSLCGALWRRAAYNPPQREKTNSTTNSLRSSKRNSIQRWLSWAQPHWVVCFSWLRIEWNGAVFSSISSLHSISQSIILFIHNWWRWKRRKTFRLACSSSLLAGCLRLPPPITHQKTIHPSQASFPLPPHPPSILFFFTSSPIRKSELREKKELNGQPQLIDSFTKQKEK